MDAGSPGDRRLPKHDCDGATVDDDDTRCATSSAMAEAQARASLANAGSGSERARESQRRSLVLEAAELAAITSCRGWKQTASKSASDLFVERRQGLSLPTGSALGRGEARVATIERGGEQVAAQQEPRNNGSPLAAGSREPRLDTSQLGNCYPIRRQRSGLAVACKTKLARLRSSVRESGNIVAVGASLPKKSGLALRKSWTALRDRVGLLAGVVRRNMKGGEEEEEDEDDKREADEDEQDKESSREEQTGDAVLWAQSAISGGRDNIGSLIGSKLSGTFFAGRKLEATIAGWLSGAGMGERSESGAANEQPDKEKLFVVPPVPASRAGTTNSECGSPLQFTCGAASGCSGGDNFHEKTSGRHPAAIISASDNGNNNNNKFKVQAEQVLMIDGDGDAGASSTGFAAAPPPLPAAFDGCGGGGGQDAPDCEHDNYAFESGLVEPAAPMMSDEVNQCSATEKSAVFERFPAQSAASSEPASDKDSAPDSRRQRVARACQCDDAVAGGGGHPQRGGRDCCEPSEGANGSQQLRANSLTAPTCHSAVDGGYKSLATGELFRETPELSGGVPVVSGAHTRSQARASAGTSHRASSGEQEVESRSDKLRVESLPVAEASDDDLSGDKPSESVKEMLPVVSTAATICTCHWCSASHWPARLKIVGPVTMRRRCRKTEELKVIRSHANQLLAGGHQRPLVGSSASLRSSSLLCQASNQPRPLVPGGEVASEPDKSGSRSMSLTNELSSVMAKPARQSANLPLLIVESNTGQQMASQPGEETDEAEDEFDAETHNAILRTRCKANSISSCTNATNQQTIKLVQYTTQTKCLVCEVLAGSSHNGSLVSHPAGTTCYTAAAQPAYCRRQSGGSQTSGCVMPTFRANVECATTNSSQANLIGGSNGSINNYNISSSKQASVAQQQQQQQPLDERTSKNKPVVSNERKKDYLKPGDWLCSLPATKPKRRHSWICR